MKISKIFGLAGLAASVIAGAVLVTMPAPPAYAQSGSRLCGWITPKDQWGGAYGFLYEARTASVSYEKECDTAIDEFWDAIQSQPDLKKYTWYKQRKEDCATVGKNFLENAQADPDMCNNMKDSTPYFVNHSIVSDGQYKNVYNILN